MMIVPELELKITMLQMKRENGEPPKREPRQRKPEENTKQAFQPEFDCKTRESRNGSHSIQFLQTNWTKNLRVDCAGGTLKKLKRVLSKPKYGKGSLDQITVCLQNVSRNWAVVDVWGHEWMCSLTVMAPKVVGATCLSKFRPIASLCPMLKILGYVWLESLPSTAVRECADGVCAEDARMLKAAELSREWQKEIVVVQLDVKKAFDHVEHRAAFKAMRLQSLSPFSMARMAAIWSGSCMKARTVERSTDESWIAPRRTRVSGHIHNDHGAARSLRGRCVSVTSVAATKVVVAEVIAQLKKWVGQAARRWWTQVLWWMGWQCCGKRCWNL